MTTRVTVLGSTGSIGTQTLEVVSGASDRFKVVAIASTGRDLDSVVTQAVVHKVEAIAVSRSEVRQELAERLRAVWTDGAIPEIVTGTDAPALLADFDSDIVLNALAGDQGLRATVAALDAGRRVALANKESLVAGGQFVTSRAKPGQLLPVDSEHSAIAQCLKAGTRGEVRRLILTASGGPFRGRNREELADVTVTQAAAHPTWSMGPLITTNSATLVNKGLELIEAHLFFDVPYHEIEVVVHPQSIVHSMVEFCDGSTIAQASVPQMHLAISLALGWPERVRHACPPLDWSAATQWTFEPVDDIAFPSITLARVAGQAGGCAPAVFNAANEEFVEAFHSERLGFLGIVDGLERLLDRWLSNEHTGEIPGTVEEIETAQRWARSWSREFVKGS